MERFKNKTFLLALATCIVTFVYQILGLFGITTQISESEVINFVGIIANILVSLGVIINPTTPGIRD